MRNGCKAVNEREVPSQLSLGQEIAKLLSHRDAALLSVLGDGKEHRGDDIQKAIEWPSSRQKFRNRMLGLEKKGYVLIDRRGDRFHKNGRINGQYPNWHELTLDGFKALERYWTWARRIEQSATADLSSLPEADRNEIRLHHCPMNGNQLNRLLSYESAPKELKLLFKVTQPDDGLTFDQARWLNFGDEDWKNLPATIRFKHGPKQGQWVDVTPTVREVIAEALDLWLDTLVFPSPGGSKFCNPEKRKFENQNQILNYHFNEAVKAADLAEKGLVWPGSKRAGRTPTPAQEKRILKKAKPELRRFYPAMIRSNVDRVQLATLIWRQVEFRERGAVLLLENGVEIQANDDLVTELKAARKFRDGSPLFPPPPRTFSSAGNENGRVRWTEQRLRKVFKKFKVELHLPPEVQPLAGFLARTKLKVAQAKSVARITRAQPDSAIVTKIEIDRQVQEPPERGGARHDREENRGFRSSGTVFRRDCHN